MPAFAGMTLLDWPHRHMGTRGPPQQLVFWVIFSQNTQA
jgi:hypothetical protein